MIFVLLLAVGLTAALIVHERYVAYGPVVARHVPHGATAIARFDLTHVMFYEPYRRFIAPLVDSGSGPDGATSRRAKLEQRGFRVAGDVRELLVAFGPEPGDWVAVIGGRMPTFGLANEVAAMLREEGLPIEEDSGVFAAPSLRLVFTQAIDSAFVLASSPERARAALAPDESLPELSEGAGGLRLTSSALPHPVESLRASFRAGSAVAVEAEAALKPGSTASSRAEAVSQLLGILGGVDPLVARSTSRSQPVFSGDTAQVSVRLPREAIEALAERAAAAIIGPRDR